MVPASREVLPNVAVRLKGPRHPEGAHFDTRRLQKPRIHDSSVMRFRELAQLVGLSFGLAHNVQHRHTTYKKGIAEQPAVALPPHRLSAHDRRGLQRGDANQIIQSALEFIGLHVVGVAAERRMTPPGVDRVRPRFAQPAQRGKVRVLDPVPAKEFSEHLARKLRVTARAWHGADVGHELNAVCSYQREKDIGGPSRMPDGVDHG